MIPRTGGVAMVVPFVDHLGGMETVALSLARRFHDEGIPTVLLSCRHLREDPSRLRPLPPTPFPILRLPVLQRAPLLDASWVVPGAFALYRRRASLRAIIAHHLPTAGALAALASACTRLPFLVVTHGSGPSGDAAALARLPARRLRVWGANQARHVTSLNPEADRELVAAGVRAERIRRVPNACDTDVFRPPSADERHASRAALGLADADLVLIYTGRLGPEKRIDRLVDALAAPTAPGVRLLLVGDGPERARLERIAGDRVAFLGRRDDVPVVLRAADAFCLPSDSEGMSVALLEAMAVGLPALVSDAPGNTEVVRHGVEGLVIARGDADGWRPAIDELAARPELRARLGAAARRRVEARHRLAATQRFYLDWFRELD